MKKAIVFFLVCLMLQKISAQEIGLQLYSLREQFKVDVPGTLAKIKAWNIKQIEGGGTYGLSMEEYKALLKKNDLQIISVGAGFAQLATNVQAAIDQAKTFGAKYIVCFWIPHKEGEFTVQNMDTAIQVFSSAGKKIKENGLQLCYHPHGYEFRPYANGTLFDYLVANTKREDLNFEMDVFWVKHPGQDPVALLKKYPKRFELLHLKDRKPGTQGNQEGRAPDESNVVLGQGDVGIAAIMKTARQIGIKYYFIEDESPDSEKQIPASLNYLKGLNKKNKQRK